MKTIFSVCLACVHLFLFSQDNIKESIINVVSYEEIAITPPNAFKEVPEPYREIIAGNVKNFPKYYELLLGDNEALYKKVQKVSEPQQAEMSTGNIQVRQSVISLGTIIEMHLNYKTEKSVASRTILDKEFLVSQDLKKIKWELIAETKNIGSLACKKASARIDDDLIEAWYAPGIPSMAGPGIYWGLPGLIVEVKSKAYHYTATQIRENVHGKVYEPAKGKKISQEEFTKLINERLNDFKREHPDHFKVTTY